MTRLALPIALVALSVAPALAGGIVAPTVETTETPPEVATPVARNWEGAYVGGTLGYAFGGDDEVGLRTIENGVDQGVSDPEGNLRLGGFNYGVRLGYLARLNNVMIGPELSYDAGEVGDEFTVTEDITGGTSTKTFLSEVQSVAALKLKAGIVMNDQTLVYGLLGASQGRFRFQSNIVDTGIASSVETSRTDYTANGYTIGAGVERRLTDRLSATAEWNYSNFGRTGLTVRDTGTQQSETTATPEHHNLKLGLNFRF